MDDKDLSNEQLSLELSKLRQQITRLEKQAAEHARANSPLIKGECSSQTNLDELSPIDINKATQIEAELKEKEQYMRLFMQSTSDCIWNWNMVTNAVERNIGFERAFGYNSQEIQSGIDWWIERLHPDDKARVLNTFETASVEGNSTCVYEYRFRCMDGSYADIEDHVCMIRDDNNKVVRSLGAMHDITKRRQAEADILEKANLLEVFYEHTDDCIVLLDRNFNFIRVNKAYAKACGRDAAEFPGQNHFDLYPSELINAFKIVVKTKEPFNIFARPFEFPDHPDWDVSYWDLTLIPILDSSGEVEILLFTLKNVTNRKNAQQEKDNLQKQLQQAQKMESIGQLTGGIAHDFNNLLTAINGYAELSIRCFDADPKSEISQYLSAILQAGKRGSDLVTKLLAYGRANPSDQQAVDGSLLIAEVSKLLTPGLPSSVNFQQNIANKIPPLLADPAQLHQVITNLVINAHHAIGEHGKIELGMLEPHHLQGICSSCFKPFSAEFIEIYVRDNGQGIPHDLINHIFEPFFTTKEAGKGSGMGLPMVHGILHQYNGHILVETNPGAGTNFRLLFQPALTEVLDTIVNEVESPAAAVKNKCIMIVDDETMITTLLSEFLSEVGYKCRAFNDSLAALKAFKINPNSIDLVVTDQTMPNLTGAELSQELLSSRPNLPIILCTGYSERIHESAALKIGIAKFLKKPFAPNKLLNSIATLLKQSPPEDIKSA